MSPSVYKSGPTARSSSSSSSSPYLQVLGMEVQAQFPVGAQFFSEEDPRLAAIAAVAAGVCDAGQPSLRAGSAFCGGVSKRPAVQLNGAGGFSGDPESELTCIASGPRKRPCSGRSKVSWLPPLGLQQEQIRGEAVPTGVAPACDWTPALNDSEMPSTTGRPHAGVLVPEAIEQGDPAFSQELISLIHRQSLEIDAFIRLQNESLYLEMDRTRKRHYRSLAQTIQGRALHALRGKEAELEFITRRNAELEEKLSQLASDNQLWIHIARNNEAAVTSLRATLEHVLRNKTARSGNVLAPSSLLQDQEEGFGESDYPAPVATIKEPHPFCNEATSEADAQACSRERCRRGVCKLCKEREVSVLMLPCRHLCVCDECDVGINTCPVCSSAKNASLRVFMA